MLKTINEMKHNNPVTGACDFSLVIAEAVNHTGSLFFTFDEIKKEVKFFDTFQEASDYYWALMLDFITDIE